MASLIHPTPVLRVPRKELELVIHLSTSQDITIHDGAEYQLTIEDGDEETGVVKVKHANYVTRGVTREWTLTLTFA